MNAQNQTEVAVKGVKISQEVLGVRVNTASCYKQTGKLVKISMNAKDIHFCANLVAWTLQEGTNVLAHLTSSNTLMDLCAYNDPYCVFSYWSGHLDS